MINKASILAVLMLSSTLLSVSVGAADYIEGKHYEVISPAQPTSTGAKVEVLELFWYGCPHCFNFEPYIVRWLKTKSPQIEFVRMPGILRPEWALYARAYYTAEVLGVLDKIHEPLFEVIHELRQPPKDEAALKGFFKEHGVSEEDFTKTFRSFTVESKVRRAQDMSQRYGASGVPTMIINGKYRTSGSLSGGPADVLKVVDYLAQKEEKK